jgi:hypothetical protein
MISHSKELYLDLKTQPKQINTHFIKKLRTLNNPNDNCFELNDYTNKTTNGTQKTFLTTMF